MSIMSLSNCTLYRFKFIFKIVLPAGVENYFFGHLTDFEKSMFNFQ